MNTIKDIAHLAGVSHGTVSNVLNGKAGVSLEKIRRVEEAVQRLGYRVDLRARNLRQKKRSSVAVIIPTLSLQHYSDLYQSLKNCLREAGVMLQLYLTEGSNKTERQFVQQIISSNINTIVTLSCLPSNDTTYDLVPDDIDIYFVGRKIVCNYRKAIFATFQYEKAAAEIADYVIRKQYHTAAYFADTKRFAERNSMYVMLQRLLGHADIVLDYFNSDNPLMLKESFEIFSNHQYDVIITANIDRAQAVASVHQFISDTPLPPIITLAVPKIIAPDNFIRYELNFKRMGTEIGARILRNDGAQRRNLSDIILENDGLSHLPPYILYHTGRASTLRILMPESTVSRALIRVVPNFYKRVGCHVQVDAVPSDDLYEVLKTLSSSGSHDLISIPSYWYPKYGRAVYSSPDDGERDVLAEVGNGLLDLSRPLGIKGNQLLCLPLDVSPQLLVYRKDLFENYMIKQEFAELYRVPLAVPRTFQQFSRAARFFTQKYVAASPTSYGVACDFETPLDAYCEFIPRLFAQLPANEDLVTEEMIALALQQLFEATQYTDRLQGGLPLFSCGNAALCITNSSSCTALVDSKYSDVDGLIGYSAVPGGHPLVLGNLIGVGRHCKQRDLAILFLGWLYSHEIMTALTFLGCLSPNPTMYQNTNIINLYPWLSQTERWISTNRQIRLQSRLPSGGPKELSIGVTVRSMLKKTISIEQATKHIAGFFRQLSVE